MPPKEKKGRRRKPKGPPKRKLKRPLYSPFNINLMNTEWYECFLKCDKDSRIVDAIPLEHLGKAMRLCALTPREQLIQTIQERIEKQQPVITPPPSDDEEEEEEEDEIVFDEEERRIQEELASGLTPAEIIRRRRKRKSFKSRSRTQHDEERQEEEERQRKEEEERKAREEEERLEAERKEEEERINAEEEEMKKKKTKRQLTWPVYKKKEQLKKLAKMKNRFKRFVTWEEFQSVLWAYGFQTQYTGQDLLWAFRTLDPKLDYELEPVWPYGADEPLVPTDEIDNLVCAYFLEGKQERFIPKETRRFLKMADFKKEKFFDFKEFVEDYCKEANYSFGVAEKKKKLKLIAN